MKNLIAISLLCLCLSCSEAITESVIVMHAWGEVIGDEIRMGLKELVASRPE